MYSNKSDQFFLNAYKDILPEFISSLQDNDSNFDIIIPKLPHMFNLILENSDKTSNFAFFLYDKLLFADSLDVTYFHSNEVSLDDYQYILDEVVSFIATSSVTSPQIVSYEDLGGTKNAAYSPRSVLMLPVKLSSIMYGYIAFFSHGENITYQEDSPQIQFLEGVAYIMAVVYKSKLSNEQFNYCIMNDFMTELPNRTHVYEAIVSSLQMAEFQASRFVLLIVKANGLKQINDSLGIITGDMALKQMGALITSTMSEITLEGIKLTALVGRLSGSDFIILVDLPNTENTSKFKDDDMVRMCCKAIIEKLKSPIVVNNNKLYMTANIGASIYPYHGETAEGLLRKADIAKGASKHTGPSSYMIYEEFMDGDAEKILFLNSNMPIALESNQFELFYQAQVDVQTEKIIGAEALIRWRHPEKGLIPPGDFISFAESNAYGIKIDKLVLKMACEQIKLWHSRGLDIIVSVNVSPKHFAHGLICDTVVKVLKRTGINPAQLKIELLESILVEDFDCAVNVINDLRTLGVRVALDDFGAGYSSLEYVAKLPMDYLKIDRTFSMNLEKNPSNAIILETIMTLAKGMGVKTIAEGVENQNQLDFLKSIGCDIVQGYFINKPLELDAFEEFISSKS